MTKFINNNIQLMLIILRYLILLLVGLLMVRIFSDNHLKLSDYNYIITTILTTTGVTVAIIITFLFSKIFSERNERVERKRQIDIESKKITALRKICYFLKSAHDFWVPFGNLKDKLDKKYSNLKLKSYDAETLSFDNYQAFLDEVNYGELGGQAYTGIREIAGNEISGLVYYDSQLRKNYSLDEISFIQDASSRIWSFFDTYKADMVDITKISQNHRKQIEKNIKLIHPEYEPAEINNEKLQSLFDEVNEAITRKMYMLTQKNNKFLGRRMNLLLLDLILFVLIILSGVFILSLNYVDFKKIFDIQVWISIFIISVIDLIINVIYAIRKELVIDDFYEL